jgi:hypothetical protein
MHIAAKLTVLRHCCLQEEHFCLPIFSTTCGLRETGFGRRTEKQVNKRNLAIIYVDIKKFGLFLYQAMEAHRIVTSRGSHIFYIIGPQMAVM